jgi:hypothetical protein
MGVEPTVESAIGAAAIYRRRVRRWLVLAGLVVVLAGCTGGSEVTTTSSEGTTDRTAVASTTTAPDATTTEVVTTTPEASTTTTGQEIDVRYEGGQVDGPDRFTVIVGEEASIWLLSDVDEEVHVHGYDLTFPVAAGAPVEITFVANVPGIFEVELEESATPLFELEVTP